MDAKKFQKEIRKAIKWLATEHYYFLELQDDLKKLKTDIANAKEKEGVKDIKHALGDFGYIGKSERRFNQHEQHIEKALQDMKKRVSLSGSAEEVERLIQRLHIEAGDLIRYSSFYEGRIKDLLTHLRDEIKNHETEKVQAALMEVEQSIEDAEKWIDALSVDLGKAKKLSHEFSQHHKRKKVASTLFRGGGWKSPQEAYGLMSKVEKLVAARKKRKKR